MSRVKVAHVATVDLSLRLLLLNQLRSLRDAGYSITGVSSTGQHVPALENRGIRHMPVPMTRAVTPITDLMALLRLYRIMRRERFTIVHCHTPKAEFLGQLAARLAGVPVVVDTFRGIYDGADVGPFRRWLFVTMARLAASCADLVFCQSREAMEMAVRTGILSFRSRRAPRERHRHPSLRSDETRPTGPSDGSKRAWARFHATSRRVRRTAGA